MKPFVVTWAKHLASAAPPCISPLTYTRASNMFTVYFRRTWQGLGTNQTADHTETLRTQASVGAPGFLNHSLCQENHLPPLCLHLRAPPPSRLSQIRLYAAMKKWGLRYIAGCSHGRCLVTRFWGGMEWPCWTLVYGRARCLRLLYCTCFIAHYRGVWDVEMNGETGGGGTEWQVLWRMYVRAVFPMCFIYIGVL